MTRSSFRLSVLFAATFALSFIVPGRASAQLELRPSLGVQTMWFNGEYPATHPISPPDDSDPGGGLVSTNNGARLQIEVIPDLEGVLRIPLAIEYYGFIGKTTFSLPTPIGDRKRRRLYRYEASMFSTSLGLTASFFGSPSLYFSVEGKFNYIPQTTLINRTYYADNLALDTSFGQKTLHPQNSESRIGLYGRIGTQVDFFDPFMLDFSIGYGLVNAFKKSSGDSEHNLFVAIPVRRPEATLGYIGIGFSIIWDMNAESRAGSVSPGTQAPPEPE